MCASAFSLTQIQQPKEQPLRLRAVLSGHPKNIERIAFSPDGKLIATVSDDFTVRIWETDTGKLKTILSGEGKAKWEQERWYYNWQYISAREFPDAFVGQLKQILDGGAYKLAISPDKRLMVTVRGLEPSIQPDGRGMSQWNCGMLPLVNSS